MLIPFRNLRKKLRRKLIGKQPSIPSTEIGLYHHSIYKKFYAPNYNLDHLINNQEPDIYNMSGNKMKTFFIRDIHFAHSPQSTSDYFSWDRYNFGLDVHFYTHNSMLETMGNPKKKYGYLLESEGIVPEDYKIFDINKGLNTEFELIFTHSEKILDKIENARFFPACAEIWYGKPAHGGEIHDNLYQNKTKNISMVSSSKNMCHLHNLRIQLISRLSKKGLIDAYGTFDGGGNIKIAESLTKYRYSIVIENFISPYFFTERITNCFASMTIPIYLGASKIDQFFNNDGIIRINESDYENIEKILMQCSQKDYQNRFEAMMDNYNRSKKYINIHNKLYEDYFLT